VSAAHELSLEPRASHNPHENRDVIASPPQEDFGRRGFTRPNWLSPEIMAGLVIVATDLCLVLAAAAAAFMAYFSVMDQIVAAPERHVLTSFLAATLFVGLFERFGGYRPKQLSSLRWQLAHIPLAWGFTVAVVLLVAFFSKTSEIYSRGWALTWIIIVPVLLLAGRGVLHAIATRHGIELFARNVAIVGAGSEGQRLIARLLAAQDKSIIVCGVFDDRCSRVPRSVSGFGVRGTTDDLLQMARHAPVDEVIIALPLDADSRLKSLCDKMKALAVDVRLSLEPLTEAFRVHNIGYVGDVPVLEMVDRPLKNWCGFAKIAEDKILSALLLLLLSPLMVLIAISIKLDSRGPVFFVQKRFGFNNEVIRVLKFRTMYVERGDRSGAQRTVRNDPRVTRVGRVLRALSMDELPQLVNVLRGDMSMVGPRPHAIEMTAGDRLYCEAVEQYLHRHRVKPGITGWAQVNGLRGEVDTLEKANARVLHDLYYIEHWSPRLDLAILLKTAGVLASRENAY
jgi:Undecaprenyl-phosphate glucose phosphotransferase